MTVFAAELASSFDAAGTDERELFEVDGADLTYISRTIAKKSLKLQTGYVN